MHQDNFIQTFINQSKEEVHEIYLESEVEGEFRADVFNSKLPIVWMAAKMNGINEGEFISLLEDVIHVNMEVIELPFTFKQVA